MLEKTTLELSQPARAPVFLKREEQTSPESSKRWLLETPLAPQQSALHPAQPPVLLLPGMMRAKHNIL